MAVTQYIGARYVPVFADPAEWSSAKQYEPLTIVLHEGNSFTSKQFVPVGIDIDNTDYWAETGNYNAQVEAYRQEVLNIDVNLDLLKNQIDKEINAKNNVVYYGADPTGTSDSYAAIQECIDANYGQTIYFPTGVYLISRPLNTPYNQHDKISMEFNGSILTPTAVMPYVIGFGTEDVIDDWSNPVSYIQNLFIKDPNGYAELGIKIGGSRYQNAKLTNIFIYGPKNGIEIGSAGTLYSTDAQITNVFVWGSSHRSDSFGVRLYGSDNKINNMRIYDYQYAIVNYGSGQYLDNVHNLPTSFSGNIYTNGALMYNCSSGSVHMTNCFCDTVGNFYKQGTQQGEVYVYIENCYYLAYSDMVGSMCFIDASLLTNTLHGMVKNNAIKPRGNVPFVGIKAPSGGNLRELMVPHGFIIEDNVIESIAQEPYRGDLLGCCDEQPVWISDKTITSNDYIYVASYALSRTWNRGTIDITVTWDVPRTVSVSLTIRHNVKSYQIRANSTHAFKIGVLIDDTKYNYPIMHLFISDAEAGSHVYVTPIYVRNMVNFRMCSGTQIYNQNIEAVIPSFECTPSDGNKSGTYE